MLVSMSGSQVLQVSFTGQSLCSCNTVPCENSMAMRIMGLVVLCGSRELDSVAATGLTSFCSVLQYAAAQRPQSFIFGLAHENVLCVQVRSVYLSEVEEWSFNHRVTPIT